MVAKVAGSASAGRGRPRKEKENVMQVSKGQQKLNNFFFKTPPPRKTVDGTVEAPGAPGGRIKQKPAVLDMSDGVEGAEKGQLGAGPAESTTPKAQHVPDDGAQGGQAQQDHGALQPMDVQGAENGAEPDTAQVAVAVTPIAAPKTPRAAPRQALDTPLPEGPRGRPGAGSITPVQFFSQQFHSAEKNVDIRLASEGSPAANGARGSVLFETEDHSTVDKAPETAAPAQTDEAGRGAVAAPVPAEGTQTPSVKPRGRGRPKGVGVKRKPKGPEASKRPAAKKRGTASQRHLIMTPVAEGQGEASGPPRSPAETEDQGQQPPTNTDPGSVQQAPPTANASHTAEAPPTPKAPLTPEAPPETPTGASPEVSSGMATPCAKKQGKTPPTPHPRAEKYQQQLEELLKSLQCPPEEERDYRLGLEEAKAALLEHDMQATPPAEGPQVVGLSGAFPEALTPLLARVVQGSPEPLSRLSAQALELLRELLTGTRQAALLEGLTVDTAAEKVKLIAERKCYGNPPRKVVVTEDMTAEALWRWQVVAQDLLPQDQLPLMKALQGERTQAGKHAKALCKVIYAMTKTPEDGVKISQEEEKVTKILRQAEADLQKRLVRDRKEQEKEDDKRKKAEERDAAERRRKEEKEAKREAERLAKEESLKKVAPSVLNFFRKSDTPAKPSEPLPAAPTPVKAVPEAPLAMEEVADEERPACRTLELLYTACGWGDKELADFEARLAEGRSLGLEQLLADKHRTTGRKRKAPGHSEMQPTDSEPAQKRRRRGKMVIMSVPMPAAEAEFGVPGVLELKTVKIWNKAKHLQFAEDQRPPYSGTCSKRSRKIKPRRPFGMDTDLLQYDYDSEASWEGEAPDGEDIGEECDDDEPEDNLDYHDGWLRNDNDIDGEMADDSLETADAAGPTRNAPLVKVSFTTPLTFIQDPITEEQAAASEHLALLRRYQGRKLGDGPIRALEALEEEYRQEAADATCTADGQAGKGKDKNGKKILRKCRGLNEDELADMKVILHGRSVSRKAFVAEFREKYPHLAKTKVAAMMLEVATREKSVTGAMVWVLKETARPADVDVPEVLLAADAVDKDQPLAGQKSIMSFLASPKTSSAEPVGSPEASSSSPPAHKHVSRASPSGGWSEHKESLSPLDIFRAKQLQLSQAMSAAVAEGMTTMPAGDCSKESECMDE